MRFEIRDKSTGRPLPVSGIVLSGPISTTLLTDREGNATFADLVPGRYSATVGAPRYQRLRIPEVDVVAGATVVVSVQLTALGLKVIGTSTARRVRPSLSAQPPPAYRKLSLDSLEALGRLPGVDLQESSDAYGERASQLSLEGHPASQTGVSIDGLPVLSSRLANEILTYGSDLFSGGSVSFDPRAGALAGSVDFSTVNPSLYWRGALDATAAAQDFGVLNYSANGSVHRTGFAIVHNVRGNTNPLTGNRFFDASGLDYVHGGANMKRSSLLKVQQLLGDRGAVQIIGVEADRATDLVCRERVNPVPCGFGPGNTLEGAFHYVQGEAYGVVGAMTVRANLYGSRARTNLDLSHRMIAGSAMPFVFEGMHDTAGGAVSIGGSVGAHALSLVDAAVFENDHVRDGLGRLQLSSAATSRSGLARITDAVSSGKFSATLGLGRARFAGAAGADFSLQLREKLGDQADLVISGSSSRQDSAETVISFVPDAGALRFFCDIGIAVGPGPKRLGGATRADGLRAGYSRRWGSDGELNVVAYMQMQHNVSIDIPLVASAFPGLFDAGYFGQASSAAASPVNCGRALPMGPGNVFLESRIPGVDVRYRGVRANGVLSGKAVTLIWQAGLTDVVVGALPHSIDASTSALRVGDELPAVPYTTYALTLDYKQPRSYVEYFAALRGYGPHNRYSARGVAALDLAASAQLRSGTLTARLTDANVDPGNPFQTASGTALEFASGAKVPVLTVPRRTRGFSVTLDLPVGDAFRRAPGTGRGLVQTRANADDKVSLPLPDIAPPDPFRIRNGSTACTFERAKALTPFLNDLAAFALAVKPVNGRYPDVPQLPVPKASGFVVHYHALGSTYALSIAITDFARIQQWLGCTRIHQASEEEVDARHLYGSPVGFEGVPTYFMPAVGVYNIAPKTRLTPFRRYALSVPNPQPFALTTYASCGRYFRPVAQELLPVLERDLGAARIIPGDRGRYAVTALGAGAYAVEFHESQDLAALLNCVHLSAAAQEELRKAGIPARPLPLVNFSKSYGFFIIGQQEP